MLHHRAADISEWPRMGTHLIFCFGLLFKKPGELCQMKAFPEAPVAPNGQASWGTLAISAP